MVMDWLKKTFSFQRAGAKQPVAPGLYHLVEEEQDGQLTRFHLRVERDGSGTLLANASASARLSAVGVLIVKDLLEDKAEDVIVKELAANFRGAEESRMRADVAKMQQLIEQIMHPGDTYPVFNLDDAAFAPHAAELIAPLQASVPLAPPEQLVPLLDRLWEVGIPHVTLLVAPGELVAEHLIRAIERAEDLGMIAGARGLARDLYQPELLEQMVQVGVDHINFPFVSVENAPLHDALCGPDDHAAAVALLHWLEERQVCAIAEIPLIQATLVALEENVVAMIEMGADNFDFVAYVTTDEAVAELQGLFTPPGMPQVATIVEETADMTQARFMWIPPMERDPTLTLAEQVQRGPRCFGDVGVRVEADGRVIPPRGPERSAGNVLHSDWDAIWNDPAFKVYRERVDAPTHCAICPGLSICAADCPGEPAGWVRQG